MNHKNLLWHIKMGKKKVSVWRYIMIYKVKRICKKLKWTD